MIIGNAVQDSGDLVSREVMRVLDLADQFGFFSEFRRTRTLMDDFKNFGFRISNCWFLVIWRFFFFGFIRFGWFATSRRGVGVNIRRDFIFILHYKSSIDI